MKCERFAVESPSLGNQSPSVAQEEAQAQAPEDQNESPIQHLPGGVPRPDALHPDVECINRVADD